MRLSLAVRTGSSPVLDLDPATLNESAWMSLISVVEIELGEGQIAEVSASPMGVEHPSGRRKRPT
jgi:hypothetical protein